jgi:aminodeoxyfutalosine synthase
MYHYLKTFFSSERSAHILKKAEQGERADSADALWLYEYSGFAELMLLAGMIKERLHGKKVYFIRNFHIEPGNVCFADCAFCSYSRRPGEAGCWMHSSEHITKTIKELKLAVNEIHITGGMHPDTTLKDLTELLQLVRSLLPEVSIKAFSAAELFYVFQKSGICAEEGLKGLKAVGLNALPGGGAEIFKSEIREKICPAKLSASEWLDIHGVAHMLGIPSNATMLYGHIESYADRVDHMSRIRNLQDQTHGFYAFIPLKFRNKNNLMSHVKEVTLIEDMKNYAVARIFLDNIPHLKTYWPMLGKYNAHLALSFGVDDFDGTINDSTRIYSDAGVSDPSPSLSVEEAKQLITEAKFTAVERDADYREIL